MKTGANFARRYGVRESRIFCIDHFANYATTSPETSKHIALDERRFGTNWV